MNTTFNESPHRRYDILSGRWVLVSAHRSKRPWQGQVEKLSDDNRPEYDENCYLCPGNTRVSGEENPNYESTFVFENDHAALQPLDEKAEQDTQGLLIAKSESGRCKVICFSPKHNLTLAEMSVQEIIKIVELWTQEYRELSAEPDINYVQIFENKGAAMGCSNPHPHGQIWAQQSVPDEPALELHNMRLYYDANSKTPMLQAYVELELQEKKRIVCENEHFVAVVPFWATWPFEILVLPKKHISSLNEMSAEKTVSYALIIQAVTVRYDNLFQTSFPYSAGIHQAPTDGDDYPEFTLHMHFYPPLLRSATVKKFMVGYEMLGGAQRDITPETSAKMLRDLPTVHYKHT